MLDGTPSEAVRPVGGDVFRGRVQTVPDRMALDFRPVAGPDIVGPAAKQQIEAPALRSDYGVCDGRVEIPHRPSAMRVVAVFVPSAGRLDHAVERDLLDDPDLSHLMFHGISNRPRSESPSRCITGADD